MSTVHKSRNSKSPLLTLIEIRSVSGGIRYVLEKSHGKHSTKLPLNFYTQTVNMFHGGGQMLWQGEQTLKEVRERCYIDPVPTAETLGWCRETC